MSSTEFKSTETLKATLAKMEGAYSFSTMRAYRVDCENFIAYCEKHGCEGLPGTPEMVVKFIVTLCDKRLRSSTVKRVVNSIACLHRCSKLPDPTLDPDVKMEVRRMYRKLGRTQRQAQPINYDTMQLMLDATENDIRDIRNRAILRLAYDTLARRKELVSLEMRDLHTKWAYGKRVVRLELRRSKTDQEGVGRPLYLSREAQDALFEWINAAKIKDGYIFRALYRFEWKSA